jgi:hypothetical protein
MRFRTVGALFTRLFFQRKKPRESAGRDHPSHGDGIAQDATSPGGFFQWAERAFALCVEVCGAGRFFSPPDKRERSFKGLI